MRSHPWSFVPMAQVIPEGIADGCAIEHFQVSMEETKRMRARACFSGEEPVPPGAYCRLMVGKALVMSDTLYEQRTNLGFVLQATGNVLVAGLGIGMVLVPLLRKPDVASITVIEKHQGVIDLVLPALRRYRPGCEAKLNVIRGDIFHWKPPRGQKWETIYFDIWAGSCVDNLDQMATLNRRFGRRLNREHPKAWKGSWEEDRLRYLRKAGRWR